MHYKIAPLILNSAQSPGKTSEIFVAQPDANKEALAGKLFALIEIDSKRSDALKIINFLANALNHNYYQNEKIILRERISTLKVEHIFETALAKTNKELAEFLEREKIKIGPADLAITVGIVYEDELHLSNIGKNRCLLIYKHREKLKTTPSRGKNIPKTLGGVKYKIADINQGEKYSPPVAPAGGRGKKSSAITKTTKFFSNIISGSIPVGGYFLFSNETLPEYLSSKQLIDIITKLPPASAVEQMKNTLGNINAYVSFLAILIKNTAGAKPTEAELQPAAPLSAQTSISRLNYTEEKTEKFLTPSGIINFKKWLKIPPAVLARISPAARIDEAKKTLFIKDKIFFKRKQAWASGKKIILLLKDIAINLINFIVYLFKVFTNKEQAKALGEKTITKIKLSWENLLDKKRQLLTWINGLSKRNKILFFAAYACLVLFLASLSITGLQNKREAEKIALNDLIKTVEQKQNQVEAHLLYNNEEGAKNILDELKILISELPQKTDTEKEYYAKILEKHEGQLEKIRHVVKIETGAPLADFANLNKAAQTANIILAGGKIYAGDGAQKTVYILGLSDNLITAVTDLNQPIKSLDFPLLDKNKNIYYLNNNSVIELNIKSEEISNLLIELPGSRGNIIAASGYNNMLYLLEKTEGQIYRYRKTEAGFGSRERWIRGNADFSSATSFSIDGHIYVLNSDGTVLKYLKGEKQDFSLKMIDPAFTAATKIIVSPELEYIYILEPAEKRLAVFNKTGQFLSQYQFPNLDNLKDFDVDETAKKIYLLNGTRVYAVDATHFEE